MCILALSSVCVAFGRRNKGNGVAGLDPRHFCTTQHSTTQHNTVPYCAVEHHLEAHRASATDTTVAEYSFDAAQDCCTMTCDINATPKFRHRTRGYARGWSPFPFAMPRSSSRRDRTRSPFLLYTKSRGPSSPHLPPVYPPFAGDKKKVVTKMAGDRCSICFQVKKMRRSAQVVLSHKTLLQGAHSQISHLNALAHRVGHPGLAAIFKRR